jgi:hypothetical protein
MLTLYGLCFVIRIGGIFSLLHKGDTPHIPHSSKIRKDFSQSLCRMGLQPAPHRNRLRWLIYTLIAEGK